MSASIRRKDTGFTLLEMLIVLALLGMLAVVLSGSIYLGIVARGRITAVAQDHQDFSSFQRIMTLKLGRAYPDWIVNGTSSTVDFDGQTDSLSFLAPALDVQGQGLSHYTVNLSGTGDGRTILLRSTLSSTSPASTLVTNFANGLASIKFEYFGIAGDGSSAMWQDDWSMRKGPPDLVAIQVSFPKRDRRSWPILVIHPDIDADVTCVIDASSHRCEGR